MAVIFADPGGEHYFSLTFAGAATAGWWSVGPGGGPTNSGQPGRQTASDGKEYALRTSGTFSKTFASSSSHYIVGFAEWTSATPVSQIIFAFKLGSSNQTEFRVDSSGHPQITQNGTVKGTATVIAPPGWNYWELDVTFATGATGAAQLWMNGVSILNLTTIITATTTAAADTFSFTASGANSDYKDIVMIDATTGGVNSHQGDVTVFVEFPNAAGTNSQWTPLSGTQVSNVQDGINHTGTWPDGDTTYIFDSTAGHISDFGHQTLSLTGSIVSVVHVTYARKDDAGSRAFRQVCVSGGTTQTNGSDISATNSYLYYVDVLDVDPNTSSAWTLTNYNNATFGVKEIT